MLDASLPAKHWGPFKAEGRVYTRSLPHQWWLLWYSYRNKTDKKATVSAAKSKNLSTLTYSFYLTSVLHEMTSFTKKTWAGISILCSEKNERQSKNIVILKSSGEQSSFSWDESGRHLWTHQSTLCWCFTHGFIAQKPVISIVLLFYLDRRVEGKVWEDNLRDKWTSEFCR